MNNVDPKTLSANEYAAIVAKAVKAETGDFKKAIVAFKDAEAEHKARYGY